MMRIEFDEMRPVTSNIGLCKIGKFRINLKKSATQAFDNNSAKQFVHDTVN